jgi:hypothetical protein
MYAVNANGGLKRGTPQNLASVGRDDYIYTNFFSGTIPLFNSSYCNPILNAGGNCVSDFGPYPAAMNGRNAFRGPGYWNINLGIYKSFFLSERFTLQFRGEFYNAFNHANLYVQNGNVDVSQAQPYVDAARGYNPALAIPTAGVNQPNLRTVQLALRLVF